MVEYAGYAAGLGEDGRVADVEAEAQAASANNNSFYHPLIFLFTK
jgi:hypothetical protein